MFGVPDERVGGLMEKAMIHGCEPSDLAMGGESVMMCQWA